jgi:hypothetical protein
VSSQKHIKAKATALLKKRAALSSNQDPSNGETSIELVEGGEGMDIDRGDDEHDHGREDMDNLDYGGGDEDDDAYDPDRELLRLLTKKERKKKPRKLKRVSLENRLAGWYGESLITISQCLLYIFKTSFVGRKVDA